MARSIKAIWDALEDAGDNGLEVTHEELLKVVIHAEAEQAPGDGLKIERLNYDSWFVAIW